MEGHLFDWIEPIGKDGLGKVMRQLRMIQIKLGFDVVDANETVLKLLNLVARLDSLAQRYNQSASSMEESAANIAEINSLVKNNALNATDAEKMSGTAMERVTSRRGERLTTRGAVSEAFGTCRKVGTTRGTTRSTPTTPLSRSCTS
jgi:methyl-accepting chemotaxis protein